MDNIWIDELLYNVETALRKDLEMSERRINEYQAGIFKEVRKFFIKYSQGYYSVAVGNELVLRKRKSYENGECRLICFQNLRKLCSFLEEYYTTGNLTWLKLSSWGHRENNEYFKDTINKYVKLEENRLSSETLMYRKSQIRQFLLFIEDRGNQTFDTIKTDDIEQFILCLAKKQPKGIVSSLPVIRDFCKILNDNKIYEQTWANTLNVKLPNIKQVLTGFTRNDVTAIIATPNRKTACGLRDAAMLLLAARTGLRSIDIVNLKLENINWRCDEISIVQHKTDKPHSLPLFPDVGNAISEYILNGRPKSTSQYVFLSSAKPYGKLGNHSGSMIAIRNIKKANIEEKSKFHHGFHSFRRSLGIWMLEAEVLPENIKEVFGHSHLDSIKPYLAIDIFHLKECALSLSDYPCKRGELC